MNKIITAINKVIFFLLATVPIILFLWAMITSYLRHKTISLRDFSMCLLLSLGAGGILLFAMLFLSILGSMFKSKLPEVSKKTDEM